MQTILRLIVEPAEEELAFEPSVGIGWKLIRGDGRIAANGGALPAITHTTTQQHGVAVHITVPPSHYHSGTLPPACTHWSPYAALQTLRLLSDRSFEKRKAGAHEVELLCRRLRELNSKDAIRKLVVRAREALVLF